MSAADTRPQPHSDGGLRPQLAGALLAVSVLTCVSGLTPADPGTPTERWAVAASVLAVLAVLALALPEHPRTVPLLLIGGIVTGGVVMASCHATQGVVVVALSLTLAGQLSAHVLELRPAAVVVGVMAATIGLAAWAAPAVVHPTNIVILIVVALISCSLVGRQSRQLRLLGSTDHLTGAYTRGPFYERLGAVVHRARRTGAPLSVVALGIDDFKQVNAVHGHLGADDLMSELVASWHAGLGAGAFLGRMGGDEFVTVLPGSDEDDARRWAALASGWTALPCSAGVATLGDDDTVRSLLARADADLFEDKLGRKVAPIG
jgi:diguanylate cyclase (GGDEF)-like protein